MTELQQTSQTPLDAILTCSRLMMNEPDDCRAIQETLLILRRFYDADRAIIFEPLQEEACWHGTYQCCREDDPSPQEELRQIALLPFRRWSELFQKHSSVIFSDIRELRDTFPEEWKALSRRNIRRLITAPLRQNGNITGSLNVCNPRRYQEDDTLILALTALLSERLNRIRTERRFHEQNGCTHKDMRKNAFYQAMLSETLAFAEVDLETGRLEKAGGLWQPYHQESHQWGETFPFMIHRQIPRIAAPEDVQDCLKHFDLSYLKLQYNQGISSHNYSFRRLINGQYCWVELVTHVFQERFTKKMYALLYLEDIDARKKRELAQESAAALDPLTNIFNRRAFEQAVCGFMEQPDSAGALIMLDLDDFKSINDTYGHPEGDAALKRMTHVLLSTFRSQDIVGRIGGDEFVIFLKNVTSRNILDRRMNHLQDALIRSEGIPLTYSAGITFVHHLHFSYSAALTQADTALYQSKQSGKNTYRYFTPEPATPSR